MRRCSAKTVDANFCAKWAVHMMRAALAPGCPSGHFSGLPKANITSFDAPSMAYAFDYGRYHFIVLHQSPRYEEEAIGVAESMVRAARVGGGGGGRGGGRGIQGGEFGGRGGGQRKRVCESDGRCG